MSIVVGVIFDLEKDKKRCRVCCICVVSCSCVVLVAERQGDRYNKHNITLPIITVTNPNEPFFSSKSSFPDFHVDPRST